MILLAKEIEHKQHVCEMSSTCIVLCHIEIPSSSGLYFQTLISMLHIIHAYPDVLVHCQ